MKGRWTILVLAALGAVLAPAIASVLVTDSPYEGNVHVERYPVAPERPSTLNATTAGEYASGYEQRLLFNDLLAERSHTLDVNDDIVNDCNATSVSELEDQFRVEVRCSGGIHDTKRLLQPGTFTYEVTYHVAPTEVREVDVEEYPLSGRHDLRTPTAEA